MVRKKKSKKGRTFDLGKPIIKSDYQTPNLDEIQKEIPYKKLNPVFSFKYYDIKSNKYSVKKITKCNDFYLLFKRLNMYSKMTWGQIELGKNRAHEVKWEITSEKSGFPDRLNIPEGFQAYQIEAFNKARIFGFHKNNIFYIVWFDVNHKIFPD